MLIYLDIYVVDLHTTTAATFTSWTLSIPLASTASASAPATQRAQAGPHTYTHTHAHLAGTRLSVRKEVQLKITIILSVKTLHLAFELAVGRVTLHLNYRIT